MSLLLSTVGLAACTVTETPLSSEQLEQSELGGGQQSEQSRLDGKPGPVVATLRRVTAVLHDVLTVDRSNSGGRGAQPGGAQYSRVGVGEQDDTCLDEGEISNEMATSGGHVSVAVLRAVFLVVFLVWFGAKFRGGGGILSTNHRIGLVLHTSRPMSRPNHDLCHLPACLLLALAGMSGWQLCELHYCLV
eukprot:SAG11_NODE_772_length_7254_cov_1.857582_7_plen_190_part_00